MNKLPYYFIVGTVMLGLSASCFAVGGNPAPADSANQNCQYLPEALHQQRLQKLHDNLKLSSSQEKAWSNYVAAENKFRNLQWKLRLRPPHEENVEKLSALERLGGRLDNMKRHDALLQERLDATKSFYATLNNTQKAVFDKESLMPLHLLELHDNLKLSSSQEKAWDNYVVRELRGEVRPPYEDVEKLSALERLEKRLDDIKRHEARTQERLDAAKAFYATLNNTQKAVFDNSAIMPKHFRELQELHDNLKLSSSQEKAWNEYVAAGNKVRELPKKIRPPHENFEKLSAPERLKEQLDDVKLSETLLQERLDAAKAFYAKLNNTQKAIFDNDAMMPKHLRRDDPRGSLGQCPANNQQ